MTEMRKGANRPLTAAQVEASLRWIQDPDTPEVDFLALLLNQSGKVDRDEDLVFFNQPDHPDGMVRLGERSSGRYTSQAISVDLAGLPASVDRVLLVCASEGGNFEQVEQLHLVLLDKLAGTELVRFNLTGEGVTALIAGEFYRRQNAWKFRAVDQGYARGLERLAIEYGINVDTESAAGAGMAEQAGVHLVSDRLAIPAGGSIELSLSGVAAGNSTLSDLSLSALAYSAQHELIDLVWFLHPAEFDDGIWLHQPAGPDSSSPSRMTLDLAALPDEVSSVVLTASSLRHHRLSDYPQLSLQLTDQRGQVYSLSFDTPGRTESSVLMAVLSRDGRQGWTLVPVREYRNERCGLDLVAAGSSAVGSLPD